MESANGTLKVERVHDEHYPARQAAIDDLTEYFGYYNTERRHSSLGYLSPAQFENYWHQAQNPASGIAAGSYPPSGALRSSQATHAPARG